MRLNVAGLLQPDTLYQVLISSNHTVQSLLNDNFPGIQTPREWLFFTGDGAGGVGPSLLAEVPANNTRVAASTSPTISLIWNQNVFWPSGSDPPTANAQLICPAGTSISRMAAEPNAQIMDLSGSAVVLPSTDSSGWTTNTLTFSLFGGATQNSRGYLIESPRPGFGLPTIVFDALCRPNIAPASWRFSTDGQ